MRVRDPLFVDHDPGRPGRGAAAPRARPDDPEALRRRLRRGAAPAPARQQLRGEPDLPRVGDRGGRPGLGVPAAAGVQPRAVRRVPAAPRHAPAVLQPGAVRARRPRPVAGDQADQGHHAPRRDPGAGRGDAARAGDRPEVPRREPDDRRPAPQRPLDGLRPRHGDRPGADGGRVLRVGAPAGLHRPRPAAPRRRHRRRAARAVPGRLDDRSPQAAHDADRRGRRDLAARPLRGRVRLGRRRRPRRPRRGDPVAGRDTRPATAGATSSAPAAASRSAPTSRRSTPRPAGRRSGCCRRSSRGTDA